MQLLLYDRMTLIVIIFNEYRRLSRGIPITHSICIFLGQNSDVIGLSEIQYLVAR